MIRPDRAIHVGDLTLECAADDCKAEIPLPVWAWLDETGTSTNADIDNDPMWEHSLLAHPGAHS